MERSEDSIERFEFDGRLFEFDGRLFEFDGRLLEFDGRLLEFDGRLLEFIRDSISLNEKEGLKHTPICLDLLTTRSAMCHLVSRSPAPR